MGTSRIPTDPVRDSIRATPAEAKEQAEVRKLDAEIRKVNADISKVTAEREKTTEERHRIHIGHFTDVAANWPPEVISERLTYIALTMFGIGDAFFLYLRPSSICSIDFVPSLIGWGTSLATFIIGFVRLWKHEEERIEFFKDHAVKAIEELEGNTAALRSTLASQNTSHAVGPPASIRLSFTPTGTTPESKESPKPPDNS
jgi:hypothetical protein